jgi:pimeloyl-ACP methyl ester carboxylesterase
MGPNHGAYKLLPEIAVPVDVVCGGASAHINAELGAKIVERLPHGDLEVFEGCGHFGPQQDPEQTVASMLEFAART